VAVSLPPPPLKATPVDFVWTSWYNSLYQVVSNSSTITWASIDKTGSSLSDITTRNHSQLNAIQGGGGGNYYHLNLTDYNGVSAAASLAKQLSTSVALTGGTIDGTTIGATTPSTGKFTSLQGGTSGTGYSFSASAPVGSFTLDSLGNLGIGVTPSANNISKSIEVGFAGNALIGYNSSSIYLLQNAYNSSGIWKYINPSTATYYASVNGQHQLATAPIGSIGGTITWTNQLTLDSSTGLKVFPTQTTPAGGSTSYGILLGSGNIGVYFGSGAPTISAAQGSLYLRTDGSSTSTRMYINTNGSTTWTNVVTAI